MESINQDKRKKKKVKSLRINIETFDMSGRTF